MTTAEDLAGHSWVLRCPCGNPHGISSIPMGENEAWRRLAVEAPAEVAAMVIAGWRLAREPDRTAVPDFRARFGEDCPHTPEAWRTSRQASKEAS